MRTDFSFLRQRRFRLFATSSLIATALAGCGGGGSVVDSPGGGGGGGVRSDVSALFHVDVNTGKVTITPSKGDSKSRAVFSGTAVKFNSSVLLDQAGDVGIKTLSVSLTNNWGLSIGKDANGNAPGLKVTFSPMTNVGAFSDIRSQTTVSTLAGTGTQTTVDGPAAGATFNLPVGVAVTSDGAVYTADIGGNVIRKIDNGLVSTLAGNGLNQSVNGIGKAASVKGPYGIAVNPVDGAFIVTEYGGNRIRRITREGQSTIVAGTGTAGGTDGLGTSATFNSPGGVAVDNNGIIYVTEISGHRIRKIVLGPGADPRVPTSYSTGTVAGSGSVGFADGIGTAASFSAPAGICFGGDGFLYVADSNNHKIRRVSPAGETVTIAGTGAAGAADGNGDVATFNNPHGIAWKDGALIVAVQGGNRIRQLSLRANGGGNPSSPNSWLVSSIAGTGSAGSANGAGDTASFNQPQLLTVDQSGNVYVACLDNRIRTVVPNGGYFPIGVANGSAPSEQVQLSNATGTIPSTGSGLNVPYITYPGAIESGSSSEVKQWWFTVPQGVSAFEFTVTVEAQTEGLVPPSAVSGAGSPDAIVRTLAGVTNTNGFNDGTGSSVRMGLIKYDDLDGKGNLYFTDLSNNALRRMTPDGRVTTIAGGPGNVATAADGSGATAKISSINAVAVAKNGLTVYFGDNNLVRVATIPSYLDPLDAGNWTINTLNSSNTAGNTNGVLTGASFNTIEDMALDSAGNLYLSEFFGNRVRKLTYKGDDVRVGTNWQASTLAGDDSAISGSSGSTDGTGTGARLFNPRGIDVDRDGNVYVADESNFLIRKITPTQVVTTIAGDGTQGYLDGTGLTTKFSLVYGICVDSAGFIYVSDIGNFTVRRISPSRVVSTVAGINSFPGGADGGGNNATFVRPAGLAVDQGGNLYVSDQSSLRSIQRSIKTGTK